jgi:SOS-response transcriptional repressor LexA
MFLSDNAGINIDITELEKKLEQKIDEKFSSLVKTQLSYDSKKQYSDTANTNDFWSFEIKGEIACGIPMEFITDTDGLTIPISKKSLPNPNNCDVLQVNGDSMSPDIEHSDLVVIRQEHNWDVCNNRIVAVRNDDGLTLKKLVLDPIKKSATLIPSNRRYPVLFLDDSSYLCGYLVLLIRHY